MGDAVKIGTRGSDLALAQARLVAAHLEKRHHGLAAEIVPIRTKGDRMQNVSLVTIGGKGVFVKELEEALLSGDVDCAVHSMKDVPVELPEGLDIGAVPEREDPRDVLVSRGNRKIEELPKGARIGTGSLRRTTQLKNLLPDIEVVPIRGNLDTRIKKIETEGLDGIIVAAAGMKRMGWAGRISQFIPVEVMVPAAGQGVIGVEVRADDGRIRELVSFLNHPVTVTELSAERAFLKHLGGGCQVPIACLARVTRDSLVVKGLVGTINGAYIVADEVKGPAEKWEELGKSLAEIILSRGGKAILDSVYRGLC
ncbi:MAG: hydroxymethylbilane synthase [Deltaproteobacteria bacterium]|nr:hydroxymethylbilane synthase [Deltaproteobacteria bacterium]